eukprot:15478377-Alexandrium_andersonii.AAC.1
MRSIWQERYQTVGMLSVHRAMLSMCCACGPDAVNVHNQLSLKRCFADQRHARAQIQVVRCLRDPHQRLLPRAGDVRHTNPHRGHGGARADHGDQRIRRLQNPPQTRLHPFCSQRQQQTETTASQKRIE